MTFDFINHWECCKDWLEFILFSLIIDRDIDYFYLQIIILNFEFILWSTKK